MIKITAAALDRMTHEEVANQAIMEEYTTNLIEHTVAVHEATQQIVGCRPSIDTLSVMAKVNAIMKLKYA